MGGQIKPFGYCVYPAGTVPFFQERYPKNFCRGRPGGPTTGSLCLVRWAGIFRRGARGVLCLLLARPPKIQPNPIGQTRPEHPAGMRSEVWLRLPPRRSAICKLCLHCSRWQRRFSGSFCSQKEQSTPGQKTIIEWPKPYPRVCDPFQRARFYASGSKSA